jgi:hypothetical protein
LANYIYEALIPAAHGDIITLDYGEFVVCEDALRACDDGVRKTGYTLLRVERRATEKAQRGEGTEES